MALTTVTLHGKILAPVTGTPAVGTVTFKILQELRDNVDNTIYSPKTFTVTLVAGEFSIELPVTDSPDVTPIDWSYWVYVDTDVWNSGVFYIPLPEALGPVVEFADLLPLANVSCTPDGSACAPIGVVGEIQALQEEVDALEEAVADLAAEITGFQDQIDDLNTRVDDVEADITTLQGQIATIQGQITTIQGQITTINGQITALTTQVATNTANIATNTTNITTLQGQITTIQGQITTINGQITTLQGQVATNTANITTIQGQITTIQTNITTLQGQVSTLQTQVSTLQGQVSTLQTDLAALAANAVLLNPTSAGTYNGNTFTPPPNPSGTQPWLKSAVIPFSAGDTNFDIVRFRAQDEFGNTVNTGTYNGNGEGRDRPSSRNRVARRTFESAEAVGGSTAQFVQWSTDATVAANREPLLGGWGTANATKPGWVEATRVLSGLLGVSIGGTAVAGFAPYNTLSAFNYRGLKTTPGAPTSGTWLVNDVILDSTGVVYRCSVAGTPGTWVGVTPPGTYVNMTPGTDMSLDANYPAASRLDRGADNVRLCGTLVATNAIPSGNVIATITAAHRPASALRPKTFIVRTTSGGARGRVTSAGAYTLNAALALNDNVWCDSITFDQL